MSHATSQTHATATQTTPHRLLYFFVAFVLLMFFGLIYAWSLFVDPLEAEFGWDRSATSVVFTLSIITFCAGMLVAGALEERTSPRTVMLITAACLGLGLIASAFTESLPFIYATYGVLVGAGVGLGTDVVMSVTLKWFPDKQGLVSGILLMGFGLSSFLIGKLYQRFTPVTVGSWRRSFVVLGIITAVLVAACGFLLRRPGTDFTPPPAAKKKRYANPVAEELGTAAMLRRPAFWLYYLWAVLLSAAGLALVSQSTSIAREIGRTVSPGGITTAVGMISLANAAGRVVLGGLFDRLGRSRTMQLVGGIFLLTGLVLIGALKLGSFPLLIAGFLLGGMAYGGVTPANAAFVSSYYGMRHYAVNLSVVVTNLLFASFGSTIAGALYDATGSYLSTDAMILVLAVLSAAVSFGIDLCDRRMLKRR